MANPRPGPTEESGPGLFQNGQRLTEGRSSDFSQDIKGVERTGNTQRLTDHAHGFIVDLPAEMKLDRDWRVPDPDLVE